MSHFSVLVISPNGDIEELLAPYDENIEVDPYIGRTKEQIIQEARQAKERLEEQIKEESAELQPWQKKLLSSKTDEDLYEAYKEDSYDYDDDGNELTTYNPKSKWDWYSIGGRFSCGLKTKDGEMVDECKVSELDISPDKEVYDRAVRFWEVYIEKQPPKTEEEKEMGGFWKEEYYTNRYKDKYHYAKNRATFSTFALVTPDGEWHEQGEMGWWGCSSDNGDDEDKWLASYKRFIEESDPNMIVTMVDCHI